MPPPLPLLPPLAPDTPECFAPEPATCEGVRDGVCVELFVFVVPLSFVALFTGAETALLCSLLVEVDVDWPLGVVASPLEVSSLVASRFVAPVVFEVD